MRALITGIGLVCSIGENKEAVIHSLKTSKSGLKKHVNVFGLSTTIGEANKIPDSVSYKLPRKLINKPTRMLLAATYEALNDSKFPLHFFDKRRIGVIVASVEGGYLLGDTFFHLLMKKIMLRGLWKLRKLWKPKILLFHPFYSYSDKICIEFNIKGENLILSSGCASGTIALGYALDLISLSKCDMVIVAGIEPIHVFTLNGFKSLRQLANKPCSPFSMCNGISVGEGAAAVIVENFDSVCNRGAKIYAEILGYGVNCDAFHPIAPQPTGKFEAKAIKTAIRNSSISESEVDYINAHGVGVRSCDLAEIRAIKKVFGNKVYEIPISSTKSIIGHTFGAGGVLEAVISILSMRENFVPPTLNFEKSIDNDLNFVPNIPQNRVVRIFVSNSFGFSGNNASCVIGLRERLHAKNMQLSDEKVVVTGIGIIGRKIYGIEKFHVSMLKGIYTNENDLFEDKKNKITIKLGKFLKMKGIENISRLDSITKLALVSSLLAQEDANLQVSNETEEKIGVVYGTTTGPLESVLTFGNMCRRKTSEKVSPLLFPMVAGNFTGVTISEKLRIKGYNTTLSTRGISSLQVITYGYNVIKKGYADALVICVTNEFHPVLWEAYELLRFSKFTNFLEDSDMHKKKTPGSIGNYSVTVILESLSSARKRGAKIYGELLNYAVTHIGELGMYKKQEIIQYYIKSIELAIQNSNLLPSEIDAIFGDIPPSIIGQCQQRKLQSQFIPISSSVIGETFGISGMISLVVCLTNMIKEPILQFSQNHIKYGLVYSLGLTGNSCCVSVLNGEYL